MTGTSIEFGLVVARRKLHGPWATEAWLPMRAIKPLSDVPPWTRLGQDGDDELFYAGQVSAELHVGSTAHYRDNLAGSPSIWVVLQPDGDAVQLGTVTLDPYEGEALTEAVGEMIEVVPMPPEIAETVAAFVAAHHVERTFIKRERDRADPEALGRRGKR
jgi:Protein of unknown function (DUF3305)